MTADGSGVGGQYTLVDSRPVTPALVKRDIHESEGHSEGQSARILTNQEAELLRLWDGLSDTAKADLLAVARGLTSTNIAKTNKTKA